MDEQLTRRLLALNREFYRQFAASFSETRSAERANVAPIMPYLSDGVKALDIGCGNGRVAERLDRARLRLGYVGIDVTPELIAVARARVFQNLAAEFRLADVSAPDWGETLKDLAPLDVVLMTAVLHHMPGFALRRKILRGVHALLKPGGTLVMSNWQFTRVERLRRKIASWQTLGIDERALEEGDALIDWRRGTTVGYRYCHLVSEEEARQLAGQSEFQVVTQFYADADLNLYSVLKKEGQT